jgi:hypothetical protein
LRTAVCRADFPKARISAFCHSASVHNGSLCGRLSSIFIPNRMPASNALIISFDGGIHFVFVSVAIPASFLACGTSAYRKPHQCGCGAFN